MFRKKYSHKLNYGHTLKLGKNTRKLYFCAILYNLYKVVTSIEPLVKPRWYKCQHLIGNRKLFRYKVIFTALHSIERLNNYQIFYDMYNIHLRNVSFQIPSYRYLRKRHLLPNWKAILFITPFIDANENLVHFIH